MRQNSEKPWYRKGKDGWYAWVDGRQVSLGVKGRDGRKVALEAFYRLMSAAPKPKPKTVQPSVKDVVDAFLTDVGDRAKPTTVDVYQRLLGVFVAKFGGRKAD